MAIIFTCQFETTIYSSVPICCQMWS